MDSCPRKLGSVLVLSLDLVPELATAGETWLDEDRLGLAGMESSPWRIVETLSSSLDGASGCLTTGLRGKEGSLEDAGGRDDGASWITESLSGDDKGVWNPENSPTAPKCTLPSCWARFGKGELGAGGRSLVGSGEGSLELAEECTLGGESLSDTEHLTEPDSTSLLWVLQIWLYCLLRFLLGLGGILEVEHSLDLAAVLDVVGEEAEGIVGLRVTELKFPLRSSSDSPLLLTTFGFRSLKLYLCSAILLCWWTWRWWPVTVM